MRSVETEEIWVPIVTHVGFLLLVYFVALLMKDNGIVDIIWGIAIALPPTVLAIVNGRWHHRTIIIICMAWLYAIRMAVYVTLKHNGEDWRFKEIRDTMKEKGGTTLVIIGSFILFCCIGKCITLFNPVPYITRIKTKNYGLKSFGFRNNYCNHRISY